MTFSLAHRYRFYAIDHDGSLVECYERGDNIMWIGSQVNSLKWTFIEYLDSNGKPTNYYDLYNPYSRKYLVPQLMGGQILVDENAPQLAEKLGINMPGRREGEYYTQFIKWDDPNYAYADGFFYYTGSLSGQLTAQLLDSVELNDKAYTELSASYDFRLDVLADAIQSSDEADSTRKWKNP